MGALESKIQPPNLDSKTSPYQQSKTSSWHLQLDSGNRSGLNGFDQKKMSLKIRSVPKTFAIFLSGLKNCLLSGSWRLFFLMYAQSCLMHSARLASFLPTTSARSALSFMGLVSPAPLGILDVFLLDVG